LGGGETGIVCARVGGCACVWPFLIIVVGLVGLPSGCPFFFLADLWLLEGVAASVFEGVSLFAAFEGVLLLSLSLLLLFVPFFGSCFLFLVLREALGASGGRGVEGGGGSGAFLRALFGLDGVLIVELLMVSSLSIVAVAVVGTLASASASAGTSVLVVVISTPVSGPLGIILGMMEVGVAVGVTFSI
jgi:hypothetical protein